MIPAERRKLHRVYDRELNEVWKEWNTPVWRKGGPFFNLEDAPDLDEKPGYNYMVGWLRGISEATGWALWPEGKDRRMRRSTRYMLRQEFIDGLRDLWTKYDEVTKAAGTTPFHDLEDYPDLDNDRNFNYSVGWLQGVHVVMDWPLDRLTGPREWSPRW